MVTSGQRTQKRRSATVDEPNNKKRQTTTRSQKAAQGKYTGSAKKATTEEARKVKEDSKLVTGMRTRSGSHGRKPMKSNTPPEVIRHPPRVKKAKPVRKTLLQPDAHQLNNLFQHSQNRPPPKPIAVKPPEKLTLPKKIVSGTVEEKKSRREELEKKQKEIKNLETNSEEPSEKETKEEVIICPFCSEELKQPLPNNVQEALEAIWAKDKEYEEKQQSKIFQPSSLSEGTVRPRIRLKRGASNLEQFTFCRMHEFEMVIKPQGKEKGYPLEIEFESLPGRLRKLQPELEDIISGRVQSTFRDTAIKAYQELGRNRARSTMGVMARFETTLPGYYGSRGASVILHTLSAMFLHTGILTKEKTAPQLPMEYLQQVMVPEAGCRLIREDLQAKQKAKKNKKVISLEDALDVMKDSCEFGNMVHSSQDDDTKGVKYVSSEDES
ncbi:hypothetical protein EC973_006840 [Apophysomyces ossiformis]|uniref:Restriction of telomere capping protein 4 n=1 Tax=Apophysomyces ossiformis TaxID=679940 RepID=A0A8H7EQT1_9FUNG|nr:hypothetical protein EC973_006840 [Apophysomyces ossiformis]